MDLVFYNRLLRCYVLIDLKRGEITHQDLGQMQMYVNYFDRYMKTDEELPTVGILLWREQERCRSRAHPAGRCQHLRHPKYQLYLPSKQELTAQLESIQKQLGNREDGNND